MNVWSLIRILLLLPLSYFCNGSSVLFQSPYSFSRNGLFPVTYFVLFCKTLKHSQDCELWESGSRMASSQVEIASSSPFSCVLRDHNHRDRCSNAKSAFQKNLKELVHSCISVTPANPDSHNSNRPSQNANKIVKKPKILDRWARAREMVFPVDDEKQSNEAEISPSPSLSNGNESTFTIEISPSQSDDSSVERRNLGGVSSLVRKWRDFEADAKNLNAANCNNNNAVNCSSPVSSRSNSESTFNENPSFVDACDSVDGKSETPTVMSEDLFFDWESDRTVPSGPPSSRGRDSDAAERERIRVADIVKKLTSGNGVDIVKKLTSGNGEDTNDREQAAAPIAGIELLARIRTAIDQPHGEQRVFPPVIGSPRLIRGRQAFSNLLMQMERDKLRELEGLVARKAVSKFSHRGRIQALLRIRFLRQGSEAKIHRRSISKTLDSNRLTIKHLRERFSTGGVERGGTTESLDREVVKETTPNVENSSTSGSGSSTQAREIAESIPCAKNSSASNRLTEERQLLSDSKSHLCRVEVVETTKGAESCSSTSACTPLKEDHEDVNMTTQLRIDQLQNNIESQRQEDGQVIPDVIRQETQEPADTPTFLNGSEENGKVEEERDASTQQQELIIGSDHDWVKEISHAQSIWEEEDASDRQLFESCRDWISDFSQPRNEWDEQESNNEQQYETNNDWISDIARPRSDWEGLRQARYQEMLDPFSDNGEIRQLLERRSVSSFLSSGLRERIDRLMISRTEGRSHPMDIKVKEQEQEQEQEEQQEEGSVRVREFGEEEEEGAMEVEGELPNEEQPEDEEGGDNGRDEEVRSRIEERQCNEYEESIDQTTSSMQLNSPSSQTTWSRNGDHEVSDDFDQFASPSLPLSLSSSSYSQNNRQCSSIEMELIYDLRGHMEQLHQEISELRKSIKSCVNMQVKLQRSIKEEVAAAVSQSVRREGKESLNPKKHSCLVCRKMKVDSLLYRCGHMCTCFKCAHELQWGSGKCPICQSPILDVVRTHDR